MTYYELFSQAKTEDDMKEIMRKEIITAQLIGNNPDRINAILSAANRVSDEKGWTPKGVQE